MGGGGGGGDGDGGTVVLLCYTRPQAYKQRGRETYSKK